MLWLFTLRNLQFWCPLHTSLAGLLGQTCSLHARITLQAPHLSLRQAQCHRQLRLPAHGDVAVALKLLLQLQPLFVGVHHPVLVLRASLPCWFAQKNQNFARGTLEGTLDFVDVHINENSASESHALWAMITQETNLKLSGATFKFRRHLKPHQLY